MSPQFTLAGLTPPMWTDPPRLVLPESSRLALRRRHAASTPGERWPCDEAEVPGH